MLIKLDQFENVIATGVAKMTTDRVWPNVVEYIVLVLGGGALTKAMITRLVLKFGPKIMWDLSATQLQTLNSYDVDGAPVTHLFLPFANHRARTLEQQYIGAPDFGALGIKDLTIEATIAGATTPTLAAYASIVPTGILRAGPSQLCRLLRRTQLNPSGAVTEQAQTTLDLGASAGALVRRINFFSALVTRLRLKRDGLDYYEDVDLTTNNTLTTRTGHVPQANVFTLDMIEDDNEMKTLTTVRKEAGGSFVPQQILMTTSGGAAFDVISDILASPNLI
jgi:Viral coat protein P2 N-terminal domain